MPATLFVRDLLRDSSNLCNTKIVFFVASHKIPRVNEYVMYQRMEYNLLFDWIMKTIPDIFEGINTPLVKNKLHKINGNLGSDLES